MVPGGSTDAARTLGGACVGGIAEAPDYRIDFAAGQYVLQFYVRSNEDTTLVINAPDGSWYCNDDTDGFDPAVFFQSPMSGQYDIWIGTFSGGIGTQATLYINRAEHPLLTSAGRESTAAVSDRPAPPPGGNTGPGDRPAGRCPARPTRSAGPPCRPG